MNRTKKRALTGFTLILMYVFGFLVIWFLNFQRVVVRGESMRPTFNNGQVLWASKNFWLAGPIKRHDVVVIREDEENDYIIKRVHWLPGEVVPYNYAPFSFSIMGTAEDYRVPQDHYYVLGDNRKISNVDSQILGAIPAERVLGKWVRFPWYSIILVTAPLLLLLLIVLGWPSHSKRPQHFQ